MKKTVLLVLLSILSLNFLLNKTLSAQPAYTSEKEFYQLKEHFDHLNGPDYNLLNGRQYELPYAGNSHPYFNTDLFRPGSLLLNGEAYDSVTINYDIFDQQLILQYPGSLSGHDLKVVLNRKSIDYFKIDGLTFRLMSFPETGNSFFQLVSSGNISCFLRWEKRLNRSTYTGNTSYKYSKQSREIYLQMEGQLYVVRNKSSFTGIFDEAYQEEIKGFLRREKIRFRNASDKELGRLMNFCMELIYNG
jgi:hypothetical protein